MLPTESVEGVLAAARAGGAEFAETYVERWRRRSLRVIDGQVKEANSGIQYGAGIRLAYGTDVVYGYTNDLSPASLLELARTLSKARGGAGRVDPSGNGGLDFRHRAATGLHAPEKPFDSVDRRYRLERLREIDAGARIDSRIAQVETGLLEWEQDVLIANSDGAWAEDRRVRTRAIARTIASDSDETQTGYNAPGMSAGLELFDRFPTARIGREAARIALTNLTAKPAPAGTMPVVLGNGFGGVIFHEALGHLLETTSVAPGVSVLSDRLDGQVASKTVTYVDEGTSPHGWGSSEFDDEGNPTESTVLIRNGVLESYMVDRIGGAMAGLRPTGSGRREDYTYAPTSRMRNTYIAPGDVPIEALFEGVQRGLYARTMGGGQVLPGSGEYNFAVKEAYMIRNGRIEEPVRGAMLVGKGPDSIRKIEAVSDDLASEPGMCGSLSGSIPVTVGQPHLLVSEIVVGGEA